MRLYIYQQNTYLIYTMYQRFSVSHIDFQRTVDWRPYAPYF